MGARAQENRDVAARAVFPGELALQMATRRLAGIDSLIAEEASTEPVAA